MDRPRPREPFVGHFPWHVATGFVIGVFGSLYRLDYHFDNGGLQAVRKNAARMGCSAAVCFGLFSAIDYGMVYARRKEEPFLNCAVAAAGAGGITFLPRGLRYAGGAALVGGALGGVVLGGLRHLEGPTRARRLDP